MDETTPGIRPRPTLWRRLDAAARGAFPAASTALAMLLAAAPLGVPGQAELMPPLALASVFFWSLFRPAAMPPPVVFLLGLLEDLLGLAPVGLSAFLLLAVHGVALRARRTLTRAGFLAVWLAFVAVAAGWAAFGWALASLLTFRLLPPLPALVEFALASGLYPSAAALLTRAHRTIADPMRA